MESRDNFNKVYSELDAVASFVKFNRKEITHSIKITLKKYEIIILSFPILKKSFKELLRKHSNLKSIYVELENKNNTLTQEHLSLKLKNNYLSHQHRSLNNKHNQVNTKYDLISNILGAKSIDNQEMEDFKYLVENDFLEFANQESSLAEEAKALLMLQNVQRELQMISSFPSIYNKNIVAVGGGFSAGKSEFISSFFVDKTIKLPIGIKPVTAIPTYISNGDKHIIKGCSYNGGYVDISSRLYAELSHDFIKSFRFNLKEIVPMMAIETEIKDYNNICFIDTPGYNPANTGTTDSDHQTASENLKNANILLWIIGLDSSDGAIPASDLDFLEELSLEDKKLFVVANKADLKSPGDLEDVLDSFKDMLDEYDIDYYGISAYSSISEKEISFRKESLIDFLQEIDNPISAKKQIITELDKIFNMYQNAISEQLKQTRTTQSDLNSLTLDFMQDGMLIDESKRANKRLEKLSEMFKTSRLEKQLKILKNLKEKMIFSANSIFKSVAEQSLVKEKA